MFQMKYTPLYLLMLLNVMGGCVLPNPDALQDVQLTRWPMHHVGSFSILPNVDDQEYTIQSPSGRCTLIIVDPRGYMAAVTVSETDCK